MMTLLQNCYFRCSRPPDIDRIKIFDKDDQAPKQCVTVMHWYRYIPVSVSMLYLEILISVGNATNDQYQPMLLMTSFNCILTWRIWKKPVSNLSSTVEYALSHEVIFIWSHKVILLKPYGKSISSILSLFWWRG